MIDYALDTPAAADLPDLLDVWEAAVRATHDFLDEADIQALRVAIRDQYLSQVALTCARDEAGRVAGFLGRDGRRVEMLFVDPARHGQGLGRRLLKQAMDEHGVNELDVNEQNPQALGFYRRMGFEVVGRSPLDGEGRPFPLLHLRLGTNEAKD